MLPKHVWEILFSSFKNIRKTGSLISNPLRFMSNQTVFGTFASWMEIKPRVECTVQFLLMLTCDPCNRLRDAVKHIDKDLYALVVSVVFVESCRVCFSSTWRENHWSLCLSHTSGLMCTELPPFCFSPVCVCNTKGGRLGWGCCDGEHRVRGGRIL